MRLLLVLLFLTQPFPAPGERTKLEKIGPLSDTTIFQEVRGALQSEGYRIVGEDGGVICEIWLRDEVPVSDASRVFGVIYQQLHESVLVGVMSFPEGSSDYRGQSIRSGVYTLRYELLRNDGNHMGVAPARDFVLLLPVETDTSVTARLTYDELVSQSKMVTGTNHPAVFSLTYPEFEDELPRVYEDYEGHLIFLLNMKTHKGEQVPIALVIVGEAEQ
ncbi:MAG: hypothetical protein V3U24_05655 [Candidatus Neomarinimicrobiota bacterium]